MGFEKEFEQFMKLNGYWYPFIRNIKIDVDFFFVVNDPCDYISAGFSFKSSLEGKDFWKSVESKWDDHYRILKK